METHQQLLELLWDQRIRGRDEADTKRREITARKLADMMAKREKLWLDWQVIDEGDLRRTTESLVESGLLISEGRRVGFAHQTLFDFGRARSFLANNSLASYVKSKQGALFVRPTLWTTLSYLRVVDPKTYAEDSTLSGSTTTFAPTSVRCLSSLWVRLRLQPCLSKL